MITIYNPPYIHTYMNTKIEKLKKKHEELSLKAATVAVLGEFDSFEVWQELDAQLQAIEKQLEELK